MKPWERGYQAETPRPWERDFGAADMAAPPPAARDGSLLKDLAASWGIGSNMILQGVGNLYGLATGEFDNVATRQGQSGIDYYRAMKSGELLQREQARSDAIAGADGEVQKALTAIGKTISDPLLLASFALEQAPMSVGPATLGRGAAAAGRVAGASVKTQAAVGTGTAIAGGAGLQSADVGSRVYEELLQLPGEVWSEVPGFPERAAEVGGDQARQEFALRKSREAAGASAALSVVSQAIPGAATIEKTIGGRIPGSGGFVSRTLGGMAGEAAQEVAEEGGGQLIGNAQIGRVDPAQPFGEGVGESAGLAAIGGGVMGGAVGALSSTNPRATDAPPDTLDSVAAEQQAFTDSLRQMGAAALQDGDTDTVAELQRQWAEQMRVFEERKKAADPNYLGDTPVDLANFTIERAGQQEAAAGGDALSQSMARADAAVSVLPGAVTESRGQAQRDIQSLFPEPAQAPERDITAAELGVRFPEEAAATDQTTGDAQTEIIWTGRRGDGYPSRGMAERGLEGRKKAMPEYAWSIDELPSGRFQIIGKRGEGQPRGSATAEQGRAAIPEIDDAIAEARAFGDENRTIALENLRNQFRAINTMRARGNEEGVSRMVERANARYQELLPGREPPPMQLPVPYVSEGAVEGGQLAVDQRPNWTTPEPDIQGTSIEIPTNRLRDQRGASRLAADGVIYGEAPPAPRDLGDPRIGRNVVERMGQRPVGIEQQPGASTRAARPETLARNGRDLPFPAVNKALPSEQQAEPQAADEQQGAKAEVGEAKPIAGEPIDREWRRFSEDSGTLNVPRGQMPQVKAEHRGALANFLKARGIDGAEETVPAESLKPTQAEYSEAKVQKAREFAGGDRAILVAEDGHVIDGHHQWMAKREAGEDVRVIRLSAPAETILEEVKAFPSSEVSLGVGAPLTDVGEKIGGARKDMQSPLTGRVRSKREKSADPAWRRRFGVSEIVAGNDSGKFTIADSRRKGGAMMRRGPLFTTAEEAERAIPLHAVSQKHRVYADNNGKFGIWRNVTDRKRVQVVPSTFNSREEAMQHMAENAEAILDTNTTFGEADIPKPPSTTRVGAPRRQGNVDGEAIADAFGVRAVEFGNWENQAERQEVVNEAYDGLHDLAEVLGVPTKAIGLNGDLALAFGARGRGLSGAKAHYEPGKVAINLTKMKGAGSLAHEWFHGLDHYFGRQDGKASSKWTENDDGTRSIPKASSSDFVSQGFRYNSKVRPELQKAYENVIQTIFTKGEKFVEDTKRADEFVGRTESSLRKSLDGIRAELSEQKDPRYWKRKNKPASEEQLRRFDQAAERILSGEMLDTDYRAIQGSRSQSGMRLTNDALEEINAVMKEVRGRQGFRAQGGPLDSLRGDMTRYRGRLNQLESAQKGDTKVRKVPTSFAMNAKELDQGRGTDYWTTPHEMAARAFQAYVEDKIGERGGQSPFLTYGQENAAIPTPWGMKRPFPAGDERKEINAAFDEFVAAMKTRETDRGVELYSETGERAARRNAAEVRAELSPLFGGTAEALEAAGKLRIEDAGPESVQAAVRNGVVTLYAENIAQGTDLRGLMLHEVGVHLSQLGKSDKEFQSILRQFGKMAQNGEKAKAAMARVPDDTPESLRTEEALGYFVEQNPELSFSQRVIAWFRDKLRDWVSGSDRRATAGLRRWVNDLSESDLIYMATAATRKPSPAAGVGGQSRADSADQTQTPEFRRWFGDSKVVDGPGSAKVVYHGGPAGITAFDPSRLADNTGGIDADVGFHFAGDRADADFYAEMVKNAAEDRGMDQDVDVGEYYLSLQDPLIVGFDETEGNAAGRTQEFLDDKIAAREYANQNGHDGIIYLYGTNIDSGYTAIAFRPEQIKSATGNRGTYDPESADILYSKANRTDPQLDEVADRILAKPKSGSLRERIGDFVNEHVAMSSEEWRQGTLDEFNAIATLEKKLNGGLLDASESAYKAAALSKNGNVVLHSAMLNGAPELRNGGIVTKEGSKGLMKILEPLAEAGLTREWELWAAAKRAKRLFEEGRERLFKPADIAIVLSRVQGDKLRMFEKAHAEWTAFNRSMLDFGEAAGLIDPESRAVWERDDYVPFHRVSEFDQEQQGSRRKRGLSGAKSGIDTLKGGVEKLSVIEAMARNTGYLIDSAMKNIAMQRTIEMAEELGVAERVQNPQLTDDMAKARLDEQGIQYTDETFGAWKSLLEKHDKQAGTVSVSVGGQAERYIVHDPLLMRSLAATGPDSLRGLIKVLSLPKTLLTALVTADPSFAVRNWMRDTLSTWVTVHAGPRNPLSGAVKGVIQSARNAPSKRAMQAQGVGQGSFYDTSPAGVRAHLRRLQGDGGVITSLREVWDAYRDALGTTEDANRIAVYDAALKAGATEAEAAYQAMDVLNFSRRGDFQAVQLITQLVPFMNARLQGLERLHRGAKEGATKAYQVNGQFAVKGLMLTGATLALLAANWDNDDYWDLEEWDRDTYYHFFPKGQGGPHYRIPKPFEVGSMFSTVPERMFEQLRDDANGKLFAERMLTMVAETLSMNPTPQFIRPAAEIATNKSWFTGRDIVSQGMQNVAPEGQYSPYTSKTFVELADAMPDSAPDWMRSPAKLEHLFRGYLGTIGGYSLMLSDAIIRESTGAPPRPAWRWRDVPVVKSFVRDGESTNKHVGRVYNMAEEVNKAYGEIRKLLKEGRKEKAAARRDENIDHLRARKRLNAAADSMSKASAQMRKIYDDPDMSPENKREELDRLIRRRNAIAKRISNDYWPEW